MAEKSPSVYPADNGIAKLIKRLVLAAVLVCPVLSCSAPDEPAFADDEAPEFEFDPELPWLNVQRPLTLQELKGKVVILDFWTYGCINCIHVLDDLKRLEHKYPRELVVIGVHSPKFDNEKNLETLRNILVRYDIVHPVVNDVEHEIGRYYGMRAWPTQVVITPAGEPLGKVTGEGNYDVLERVVGEQIAEHAPIMDPTPVPMALERDKLAKSLLAAPGKIAVSERYVAISDTLHHRVLVTDHTGKIQTIYGGPEAGRRDGSIEDARFSSPQGLAFSDRGLYVADTGNHQIRYIDLERHSVTTVAGNGAVDMPRFGEYDALRVGMRSPWGLVLRGSTLYIAMAGSHQIWLLDRGDGRLRHYAGSGQEGIADGSLIRSSFSQPSGLSLAGNWLYVADAEDSGVRRIDLDRGQVETLVGTGLFDFGDRDGPFESALLQHVLGIAALDEERILIADTYNHKLKSLNLREKTVTTLAGTGEPGRSPQGGLLNQMNEPGGLAVLSNLVLIADTNNNRILQYDPTADALREWTVTELQAPGLSSSR